MKTLALLVSLFAATAVISQDDLTQVPAIAPRVMCAYVESGSCRQTACDDGFEAGYCTDGGVFYLSPHSGYFVHITVPMRQADINDLETAQKAVEDAKANLEAVAKRIKASYADSLDSSSPNERCEEPGISQGYICQTCDLTLTGDSK